MSLAIATKRKQKKVTFQTKCAVLQNLENRGPNADVANQFDIPAFLTF